MLVVTRKPGEKLHIGANIRITVVEVKGNRIKIGIEAPVEVPVFREEIQERLVVPSQEYMEARCKIA